MAGLGSFVWFDLMTPSTERAVDFYTHVMGWGVQHAEAPMPYTMWTVQGKHVGGVMTLPSEAGVPPHWLGYVSVSDCAVTTERVARLGGAVLRPLQAIPGTGVFSVVADPQGAAFALFQAERPSDDAQPPAGTAGLVGWSELNTRDYQAAWRFYSELLGWKPTTSMDMGELGQYFMFEPAGGNGTSMGGMSNTAEMMGAPPHWLFYVNVDALDPALERVRAHGGAVLNGPMEVPGGDRIAQCRDPEGAHFALYASK